MTVRARADVVSSFTIIKGPLVEETYRICCSWDFTKDVDANLESTLSPEFIGGRSSNWARDVRFVIRRRFDFNGPDRALAELAQRQIQMQFWKPIMLWHMTRDEFLVRDFFSTFLYGQHRDGTLYLQKNDVIPYLEDLKQPGRSGEGWTARTAGEVAGQLLKIATEFGFLAGNTKKTFATYQLPDEVFIYLLHFLAEHRANARAIIHAEEWRLFLLDPDDVERDILRLHQFRKLHYEVAGSLAQLTLPCESALAYARRMAA